MKRYMLMFITMLTATTAFAQQPENSPEQLFRMGLKKYADGEYQPGVDLLTLALQNNPTPPAVEPSLLHYNIGIGYYRLSLPEQAAAEFEKALRTPDISLQAKTYFNLGNAQYQQAQSILNEGDIAQSFRLFQSAATNYMEALRLNHIDHDAKVNFELSTQAQMRILQMVAMAMARLQQGEQMVDQFRFVEAAQWFQENLPMMEKALSLEPEVKKQFETMTERSTAVAEIIMPSPQGGGMP